MIIRIWDYLFTRRVWKIIDERQVFEVDRNNWTGELTKRRVPRGTLYVLQDQFGNIKQTRIGVE